MPNCVPTTATWDPLQPVKSPVSNPGFWIRFALTGKANERAATAVNISEQRIAARVSVFIVISRFGTDAKRLLPVQARHWESPVARTHRGQMNRRTERSFKSITKFTYFAVVPTAR